MEQSRDKTITAAGMVVGVALVSTLIEGVITVMRFCAKVDVIALLVSHHLSVSVARSKPQPTISLQ